MSLARPALAGLLVVAALAPSAPRAESRLEALERAAAGADERLLFVEKAYAQPDESATTRARRKYSEGETQFLLGDWLHASVLLFDAVEQPELLGAEYPQALLYLADALRSQGAYPAALAQYQLVLALPAGPGHPAAVAGALDCRLRLHRFEGLDALLEQARAVFPDGGPPEVAYLTAKALYQRADLTPSDRRQRADAAFAVVPPPYLQAAAYFRGVLRIEGEDLPGATEQFERCTGLAGAEPRQVEIRELCQLALGRVYAEQQKWAESLDRYQGIPLDSPRFNEALYEIAWNYVKARRFDEAQRTAGLIVDLAADSRLSPEAALLVGHLDLKLGRHAEAIESFQRVIATYRPVREDVDAVLTMHADPVAYFNEVIRRQGKAFDVASVLPAVAVKWASTQQDVAAAMEMVGALDLSARDVRESAGIAERLDSRLRRGGGLDASPLLEAGWRGADAVETAAVRLQGQLADLQEEGLPAAGLAGLAGPRGARQALQPRLDALPATPEEAAARRERVARRIDGEERAVYQLGYQVESSAAAIAGTEAWLKQHKEEIVADALGHEELTRELRAHRDVVLRYQEELRELHRQIEALRDAAGGVEWAAGEAALRRAYRERLAEEQLALAGAGAEGADPARSQALQARLARTGQRAQALKEQLAGTARRRAEGLRARVQAEASALAEERQALEGASAASQDVVGRIAYHSFSKVRAEFHRLVMRAEVGLIDETWVRKEERAAKIQQLSQTKAKEMQTLERDFQPVLREAE